MKQDHATSEIHNSGVILNETNAVLQSNTDMSH